MKPHFPTQPQPNDASLEQQLQQLQQEVGQLRQENEQLRQHANLSSVEHSLLEATAQATNTLLTVAPLEHAVNIALQILGESLDTDRVNIIETVASPSNSAFPDWRVLEYEWNSSGTVPQFTDQGAAQGSYKDIPEIFKQMHQGQILSYLIEEMPEPFRSEQMAIGVKSTHLVPIFVEGQWWGVLGMDDCREAKQRSRGELAILKVAADCIGSAIERNRTQQALLQAEQERTRNAAKHSQELERINAEQQQTLNHLSESEEQFRTLFELSSEGFYYTEVDPPCPISLPIEEQCDLLYRNIRVVKANPAFAAMYGVESPDELIGLRNADVHVPDSEKNAAFIRGTIENGYRFRNLETEEVDTQGQLHYFLNNGVYTIKDGYVVSAWSTQVDITELRKTQQAFLEAERARVAELAKANEELQQREHEVQQSYRLLSVVAQVTKDLLETEDIDIAIPAALQAVGEVARMSRVQLLLERQDTSAQKLYHVVAYEWVADGIVSQIDHPNAGILHNDDFEFMLQDLHAGRSIWHIVEGFPSPIREKFESIGIKSCGTVPIFIEGRYIGGVGFDDCITPRQWSQQEIDVLTTAAESIGAALHRKQLVDRLIEERIRAEQERTAELKKANEALARTSQRLVEQPDLSAFLSYLALEAIAQLGADAAMLSLLDEQRQVLRTVAHVEQGYIPVSTLAAEIPVEEAGFVKVLLEERKPRYFNLEQEAHLFWEGSVEYHHQHNHQAIIGIPLFVGGNFLGHLGLAFTHTSPINEQSSELLHALAQQAALAIQLTRLAEEAKQAALAKLNEVIAREQEKAAQERAAELAKANEVLARTSSRLAEQPDLSGFLGHIMLEAVAQMGADGGHLTIYDPQQEIISTAVLVEQGKVVSSLDFPPNMPISEVGFIQLIRETRQLRYFDLEANFEQDAHLLWQDVGEHHKRRNHVVGIAIPLFIGDEFLGHFGLAFTNKKVIDEQNLELLQALANQAALAIQLTRLAEAAKQAAIAREQEKAAQERAAELEKASIALQQTIDAVGQLEQLDALLPEVLRIVVAAFGARSCGYFEHPTDERIYLRYWFHEGTVYKPEELLILDDRFVLARSLAQGFTIPTEYLGTPHRHRECAVVLNHLNGTCVPEFDAFAQQLGWGGELNVPLVCNGIALGALVVYRETPTFTQGEITLAESLGKQIALAMQTSYVAEREREIAIAREQQKAAQDRATELAKTNDALKHSLDRLAQESNLNSFLGHVLTEIANQVRATVGHIFLLNTETNTLKLCLEIQDGQLYSQARPDEPMLFHSAFPMDITPVFQFLCQKRTLASLTAGEFDGMEWNGVLEWIEREGFTEAVGLALIVGDQPVGLLGLGFRHQSSLKPEEVELVQALAHQATLAIQMGYLAEQAKQAAVLEERNRMAREIHDTIAQGLAGILIQLQAAEDIDLTNESDRQAHMTQARHLAEVSLAEARRSVRALRPQVLEETNLAGALTSLMRDLTANTSLQVTCRVQGALRSLSTEVETNLLRIAQEAINNTLKHAEATHIQIELSYQPNHVQLRIQDDGQGFDYDQLINLETSKEGYGLISMQERSQQIGGNLAITSQFGEGTVLTIVVPLTL